MRTRRNSTSKAGAVGVALLCMAALGVTTGTIGAYWTNSVEANAADGKGALSITAGSGSQLSVTGGPFVFSNIYPGWTMNSGGTAAPGTVTIKNDGSTALTVDITPKLTGKDSTQPSFPATGTVSGDLFAQGFQITVAGAGAPLTLGYNQDNWGSGQTRSVQIPANSSVALTITADFPYWPGDQNPAQGDAVKLELTVTPRPA